MQTSGWIQLALFVVVLAPITKPMGLYLMRELVSGRVLHHDRSRTPSTCRG